MTLSVGAPDLERHAGLQRLQALRRARWPSPSRAATRGCASNAVDPGWIKTKLAARERRTSFRSVREPRSGSPPATTRTPRSRAAISSGRSELRANPDAYDTHLQEALLAACATLAGAALPTSHLAARRPVGCPHAVPATPIRLPSGSVKWPITRPVGARSVPIPALAAEALGLGERGLDVGHADVEDDVGRVAGASADAARDARPVGGRDAVNEAVVSRLRHRFGDRGAGVELPAEQLAEVAPELVRVVADDLEVHNRVCHEYSFPRICALPVVTPTNGGQWNRHRAGSQTPHRSATFSAARCAV